MLRSKRDNGYAHSVSMLLCWVLEVSYVRLWKRYATCVCLSWMGSITTLSEVRHWPACTTNTTQLRSGFHGRAPLQRQASRAFGLTAPPTQHNSGQLRSTQLNSAEVNSGQVNSGQVVSGQLRAGQLRSGQLGGQRRSTQLNSDQVRSGQGNSDQVKSSQVKSSQVKSSQVKSSQVKSTQLSSTQVRSTQRTFNSICFQYENNTGAYPKIRTMSPLLILNFVHSEFVSSFIHRLIHSQFIHVRSLFWGHLRTTLHKGRRNHFFSSKSEHFSTFMPNSR
jgi:hypothetical protein